MAAALSLPCDDPVPLDPSGILVVSLLELDTSRSELLDQLVTDDHHLGLLSICRTRRTVFVFVSLASLTELLLLLPTMLRPVATQPVRLLCERTSFQNATSP